MKKNLVLALVYNIAFDLFIFLIHNNSPPSPQKYKKKKRCNEAFLSFHKTNARAEPLYKFHLLNMRKVYTEQLMSGTCISWKKKKSRILSEVGNEPKFTTDSLKRDRSHFPNIKNKHTGSYTALKYLMLLN